jgi:hypothetical protein
MSTVCDLIGIRDGHNVNFLIPDGMWKPGSMILLGSIPLQPVEKDPNRLQCVIRDNQVTVGFAPRSADTLRLKHPIDFDALLKE